MRLRRPARVRTLTAVSVALAGVAVALAVTLTRDDPISKFAPTGRVVDLSGKRVANARLATERVTDDRRSGSISSRANGSFVLAQIEAPGVYELRVEAAGYCPFTDRVQVWPRGWKPPKDRPLLIRLRPASRVHGCHPTIDVYSMAADGSDIRRVTLDDRSHEIFVRPSPLGDRIAYVSEATAVEATADGEMPLWERLMVADSDGSNARSLGAITLPIDFRLAPVWSPDGRRLAWSQAFGCVDVTCESMEVWTVDVRTGARRRIARSAIDPQWSPDGRRLAYTSAKLAWDESGGGNPDSYYATRLFVARADGTQRQLVARDARSAKWSSDGTRLRYLVGRSPTNPKLVSSQPDGSQRRVLGSRPEAEPRRSPDGRRVAWVKRSTVVLASAEGRSKRRVQLGPRGVRVWAPVWSSDGRRVYFLVGPPGTLTCVYEC
jgi:Tol biopolymer transport system component